MEIYNFTKDGGKRVTTFNSDFVLSRIIQINKISHINCMYLDQEGIIGYHQAVVPQLMLVVQGEGLVRAEEEKYVKVQAGDAVYWDKNEWHETKTDTGLTAIVIESEDLDLSLLIALNI